MIKRKILLIFVLIATVSIVCGCSAGADTSKQENDQSAETKTADEFDNKANDEQHSENAAVDETKDRSDPVAEPGKEEESGKDPLRPTESVVCFNISEDETTKADIDIDGDGKSEAVEFEMTADEDGMISSIRVTSKAGNSLIKAEELYGYADWGVKCAWFTTDRGMYIYVQSVMENDYMTTYIYRYEDGDFKYVDETGAIVYSEPAPDSDDMIEIYPKDPEDFFIGCYEQKLGTLWLNTRCRIGSSGVPEPKEKISYYNYSKDNYWIKAKADIPAMIVDEDGNNVAMSEIAKGSFIIPYRTNGEDYIDVYTVTDDKVNDEIMRLLIEHDGSGYWRISGNWGFDSNDLPDLFDGLIFAG